MSAWIVSPSHIDVIVQGLKKHGLIPMGQDTATGRKLYKECIDSVSYRYGGESLETLPGSYDRMVPEGYKYVAPESELNDANYAAAVACYEYQSCEHPGWEDSEAKRLVGELAVKTGYGDWDEKSPNVVHGVEPRVLNLAEGSPWGFDQGHVHPDGREQ